eukprot:3261600-Heterocapsa_arctica.AAC.1
MSSCKPISLPLAALPLLLPLSRPLSVEEPALAVPASANGSTMGTGGTPETTCQPDGSTMYGTLGILLGPETTDIHS